MKKYIIDAATIKAAAKGEANAVKAIESAIKVAEGSRVSVRKLCASKMIRALHKINEKLDIPNKALKGCTAVVDANAQSFPNSYHGIPESTYFAATHTGSGWAITAIYRKRTAAPTQAVRLQLTDTAREAIVRKVECFML